jgi:hypothetical protein
VRPSEVVEEPLSPELVLVDRELARRARAAQPDAPWLLPVLTELQEAELPADPRLGPAPVAERASRPSIASRVPVGALTVFLLLGLVVLGVSLLPPSPGPSFVTEPAQRAAVPTATRAPSAGSPKQKVRPSNAPRAARPKAGPADSKTQAKPAVPVPRRSARPRPRAPRKVQRVFSWHRYPAAVYYELHLQRGTTTIYETRTVKLTAALPAGLQLRRGIYHVLVRPAIPSDAGIILGAVIVDKTIRAQPPPVG